ncbi:MAG: glycine--tRNA ligase subunit beta [Acidimicrobiia bacterium]|nr:glycine--tRNA ligase subunit beta [Acidimicrobiia bacterium]
MTLELFLEVGCEEIPARFIDGTLAQFREQLAKRLTECALGFDAIHCYATPRRLVFVTPALAARQADRTELVTGPPKSAAYDTSGNPTAAARGFAAKQGVGVESLKEVQTDKGVYLAIERRIPGRSAGQILSQELPLLLASLSFPKSMRWEPSRFLFVRPIRWMLCRLQGEVLPFNVAGVTADGFSYGHRILAKNAQIEVNSFEQYQSELLNHKVRFDANDRRAAVESALAAEAAALGARVIPDRSLLDLVVNLNEYPTVVSGRFDPSFLRLPKEVLVTVMREHQKYFSLVDAREAALMPCFLAVVDSDGSHAALIRAGHERVLRARLADAGFFWDLDRKVKLEDRVEKLGRVVFQQKLGTMLEKTHRLVSLTGYLGRNSKLENQGLLKDAARLCKSDLITEMVKEFADLQGVMGGLYAEAEGLPTAVCRAIYEHYRPQTFEDASPETCEGGLLSIADRLDSVVGAFAIGQVPTGSKDPLALRRQTLGIIKVVLDQRLSLSMEKLFFRSFSLFKRKAVRTQSDTWQDFSSFLKDRLRFAFKELGFRYDEINAVVETRFDNPCDCLERLRAIAAIRSSADFEAVAQGFKRIKNILQKSGMDLSAERQEVDSSLFESPEERRLAEAVEALRPKLQRALRRRSYTKAFELMAALRPTIDLFFDQVLVMAEDQRVRLNRLNLLRELLRVFFNIADVSEIVPVPKEGSYVGAST